jgi:hypothetical protein
MGIEETINHKIAANEADEPVALDAHIDWAEAVKNTVKNILVKKLQKPYQKLGSNT